MPLLRIQSGYYYKPKKFSKKYTIGNINTGWNSCRDSMINGISYVLYNKNGLTFSPPNKDIKSICTYIGIELHTTEEKFSNYKLFLDYILGILSTCMSHDEEEVNRKSIKRNKSPNIFRAPKRNIVLSKGSKLPLINDITKPTTIKCNYNISPFIMNVSVLISLFSGLARNLVHLSTNKNSSNKILKDYIDNVSRKEIYRILDELDYKSAQEIYTKYVRNILRRCSTTSTNKILSIVDKFVSNGYKYYFDPNKTLKYWNRRDVGYYGISSYSMRFRRLR